MYANWISLTDDLQSDHSMPSSVLNSFGHGTSTAVVLTVVKSLQQQHDAERINKTADLLFGVQLETDRDVQWTMEVLGFGLTLPLEEEATLRACIDIYKDWLSPLIGQPVHSVPKPVLESPELYAQKIINQYSAVFSPRKGHLGNASGIRLHATLCRQVLATVHTLACKGTLSQLTWECILKFMLNVCHRVLAPPTKPAGFAEHLADRLIATLFDVFLRSCEHCFPSPPFWLTLQEMCCMWRHHHQVVEQWSKTVVELTLNVIQILYGPSYGRKLKLITEDDEHVSLSKMANDCITQCWFRMLHTLGNLVDLSHPDVIASMPAFLEEAQRKEDTLALRDHVCLRHLPRIFFKAMRGLAANIDAFLTIGTSEEICSPTDPVSPTKNQPGLGTPTKSKLVKRSTTGSLSVSEQNRNVQTGNQFLSPQFPTVEFSRPDGNSLLHLFGKWLFEATITTVPETETTKPRLTRSLTGKPSLTKRDSATDLLTVLHDLTHHDDAISSATFEAGRAEAFGALCRIFCKQKCAVPFNPVYLARFYHAIAHGLQYNKETCTGQVLTSILMNSTSLFQNDLVGVHVLLPHFVSALEIVLPVKKHEFRFAMPQHDLRRSCIRLTLSIIMLPHHFRELPIADVTQPAADPDSTFQQLSQTYTFLSFHERLAALLFSALRIEQDPGNIHLLLCSVQLLVQDAATFEALSRKAEAASSTSTSDKQPLPKVASDTHVTADGEFAIPKISDDAISEGSDAAGLFVRACRDIPQRFLHPKTDLSVTLSVLELLASLAQLDIPTVDPSEWQFTVKWLCDYIATLVGQPRPSHIRDLHSMIVAAYQCLQAWIMAKHRVLCEKDSLHHVLEVIELGLSGSKSEHLPSDTGDGDGPKRQLKGEKERHPVSIRVREAAEVLFFCITEHLGSFPSPCGPAVASCQVTETEMLALAAAADPSAKNATLRYFVLDSSTVIGVLEHSISPHSDTSPPTVTILSRTPAGKRCWTMQLRHWPRSAGAQANDHLKPVKGPDPKSDEAIEPTILKQFWPEAADSIEPIKADYSIPSLDQILDSRTEVEQAKLHDAVKKQATAEADALTKHHQSGDIKSSMQATRVDPPPCCASFQTSRLFLSHLGVLSLENLQAAAYRPQPALVSLDNTTPALAAALHDLDSMPTRNTENVYVLYVRTGQSKLTDIFRNKGTLRSPPFHEFLLSLGWPVDILSHPGWKGPFSSPRFKFCKLNPTPYYADITVEMLFVVPSLQPQVPFLLDSCTPVATVGSPKLPSVQNITDGVELKEELTLSNSDRVSHSAPTSPTDLAGRRAHTVTQTPPNRLGLKRPGTRPTNSASSDLALGVVWLERFEDYETFPLEDFSHAMNMLDNPNASTSSSIQLSKHGVDCVVIFIHPLNTGLYRIKVASTLNRGNCGGPLLDGMAVSRRVLGLLVRQTVINITRRRRLDTDSCVPPHVPRKRKIEEMTTQFEQKYTIPQFFDSLFAHAYTASHE